MSPTRCGDLVFRSPLNAPAEVNGRIRGIGVDAQIFWNLTAMTAHHGKLTSPGGRLMNGSVTANSVTGEAHVELPAEFLGKP